MTTSWSPSPRGSAPTCGPTTWSPGWAATSSPSCLSDADDERLRDVADRLLASLRAPVVLGGTTLTVTASIGGALGAPGDTADRLLHRADTAMYAAKRSGKNSASLLGGGAAQPV